MACEKTETRTLTSASGIDKGAEEDLCAISNAKKNKIGRWKKEIHNYAEVWCTICMEIAPCFLRSYLIKGLHRLKN